MNRGEIWWASLPAPAGHGPGFRRPVLVISADSFNASRIGTVIAVAITSNLKLAAAPGNVRMPARAAGLVKASVINVSQVVTLDKACLTERAGRLPPHLTTAVDAGLKLSLGLQM